MAEVEPEVASALQKLNTSQHSYYVVGVDIGGTHARVAVGTPDGEYVIVSKFLSRTIPQLRVSLEKLTAAVITYIGRPPAAVCMAIAGPITEFGTVGEMTNYEGATLEERLVRVKDLSPAIFPHATTRFVNDLESCCYGVLALDNQKILGDYFAPVWSVEGDTGVHLTPTLHHAVLAAGTGFGVGLLVKLGPDFQVYPIEYGHAILPPLGIDHPYKELDERLANYLSHKLYAGKFAPEYEDIVSGRGIAWVYEFLVQGKSDCPTGLSAAEIVSAATFDPPNKYAVQALTIHYRILMRAAQNVAVALQVKGGLLLAGDNQVANDILFRSLAPELKAEFLNHPKRHWIENVPVYAQTKLFNINLFGTLFVARSLSVTRA